MFGKLIGGVAGLAVGGPLGAVVGVALGHAADSGALRIPSGNGRTAPPTGTAAGPGMEAAILSDASARLRQLRLLVMLGQTDRAFAIAVTVLAARLAKVDGVVTRPEIEAFRRHFSIAPQAAPQIGRLFNAARDGREPYEPYARELGRMFADAPGTLEDVLAALFAIARADAPLRTSEHDFLVRVHASFAIPHAAFDRARGATSASSVPADPYGVLGLTRAASDPVLRATWKRLMREHHPDSLASRGVPPEMIASASERVARINAAWDHIKRERGL